MKSVYITLLALLFLAINSFHTKAQDEPMFTNYINNPLEINPAIPGTMQGLNMNLLTRHQWLGMDGSPASYNFGAHLPYPQQEFGVGLNIMSEKVGPVKNTHIAASYGYQLKLLENVRLSMGLQAGINSFSASIAGLDLMESNDENFQSDLKRTTPNFGMGAYLFSDQYFAGLSSPRLIHVRLNEEYQESDEPYNPAVYMMGGYNFDIGLRWDFLPSTLFVFRGGAPLTVDLTTRFLYQEKYYLGAHYRTGDAIGVFFNMEITNELKAGYAFDFTLNKLAHVNSGTHELMVSYNLNSLW